MATNQRPYFVTLGMFIIDEFSYVDEQGQPTGKVLPPQIGGGGTYAAIGARIWLSAGDIGMVIDRGTDFPPLMHERLKLYGSEMWFFRNQADCVTTRALNSYRGDHRNFEYTTPRIRIAPHDLLHTRLERCVTLHFVCSPWRAAGILKEIEEVQGWHPVTIYEPIPDRCIPEELPKLIEVLPSISILSPNAEEALSLLSFPSQPTKLLVELAAARYLEFGVGHHGGGCVIIRSGAMGAYVATREKGGRWIEAFWTDKDPHKIVDVTGAGNSFLGGLAAGLLLADQDIYKAAFYATVSASFVIEQEGLPSISVASADGTVKWNDDIPRRRLEELMARHD